LTLILLVSCGLAMDGCQTVQTTRPGAVGLTRKQHMIVSEQTVEQAAAKAYAQQEQEAQAKRALDTDPALTARVRQISRRLIAQTGAFRPDAPGWNWQIHTLRTDELNAYCMPGGKIMVYSGLVDRLHLTDAELATVIGHEMGHALREHARERISQEYVKQIAITGAAVLTGAGQVAVDLASAVANVSYQLPHSREQEREADDIGLELMARAGYDPHAAINLWEKMMKANASSGTPQFLSTHPASQNRIKDLQRLVPRVMPLYQAAEKTG
jgi:predicted Zn-dependent protease